MLNKFVVTWSLLLSVIFLSPAGHVNAAGGALIPSPPKLAARSFVLLDVNSGKILAAKDENAQLPPASLTKMMTSYVLSSELAKGNVHEDDQVTVSRNAWAQNPVFKGSSRMFIEVGKQVRLGDLHRGLIISSGNDASVALAEHIAGSEDVFAEVMNQQADKLGMADTHFVNAHGLPGEGQHTSALDMARLARAVILDYPEDYRLYAERSYTYNDITQSNRNQLLWRDPTVDGLKTGYTKAAGYCLVASAERDGMRLVGVVMGARSAEARVQENQKLLQYGFRYFETLKLYSAGDSLQRARVWSGTEDSVALGLAEDLYITIPRGRRESLLAETEVDALIQAPVEVGGKLGVLHLSLDGEPLWQVPPGEDGAEPTAGIALAPPLVALQTVEPAGIVARLWHRVKLFFYELLGWDTN
jgi:D-alanyl-D-alanine carboxypeptidase (penicillin-binding protein 5/6)